VDAFQKKSWGRPVAGHIGPLSLPASINEDFTGYWTGLLIPLFEKAIKTKLLKEHHLIEFQNTLPVISSCNLKPVLLHGDLWNGNVLYSGSACLIDPSLCFGPVEQDLAFLELFGSPLDIPDLEKIATAAGSEIEGLMDRITYFQIYPLLVHVLLYGSTYVAGLERVLKQFK
jgi:fructosamine-3-kinase